MEFLVEFEIAVPEGTPASEYNRRLQEEGVASAGLAEEGHLIRVWRSPVAGGEPRTVALYRADSAAQLDDLLGALPLAPWMRHTVKQLEAHPFDPAGVGRRPPGSLPDPALTLVYRLEATLGKPLDLGDTAAGHKRIAPLTGGRFTGPRLQGRLLPGSSADWQTVLPDGTTFGDIRYTLQTDAGEVLYVRSRSVRHGRPEVLARLGRGADVDPSEYTFRTSTQIETGAGHLDWLNQGVFVSVAGRQPAAVIYETYLVG
jgi:muconolactone delta-isomerase